MTAVRQDSTVTTAESSMLSHSFWKGFNRPAWSTKTQTNTYILVQNGTIFLTFCLYDNSLFMPHLKLKFPLQFLQVKLRHIKKVVLPSFWTMLWCITFHDTQWASFLIRSHGQWSMPYTHKLSGRSTFNGRRRKAIKNGPFCKAKDC